MFSGPYLELFARFTRDGWHQWGNEDVEENTIHNVAKRKGHVGSSITSFQQPQSLYGKDRRSVIYLS